jgi:hypothetical protein
MSMGVMTLVAIALGLGVGWLGLSVIWNWMNKDRDP